MKYPTLILSTPSKKGKAVRLLQYLLKHNRFGQDFLRGPVDGVYGPQTALAVRRAKYWAGFDTKSVNGAAGDALFRYLLPVQHKNGWKLPLLNVARRKFRLAEARRKAAAVPVGQKALRVALTQIGVREEGHSNVVRYSEWYGMTGPWCAMFVSWCLDHVGSGFHYAYCPYVWGDAEADRNGLSVVNSAHVEPGNLVLFNWGSGEAKHIGFVEEVLGDGWYQTIEGNTQPDDQGDQSNGGGVYRRKRHISQILGFVEVA